MFSIWKNYSKIQFLILIIFRLKIYKFVNVWSQVQVQVNLDHTDLDIFCDVLYYWRRMLSTTQGKMLNIDIAGENFGNDNWLFNIDSLFSTGNFTLFDIVVISISAELFTFHSSWFRLFQTTKEFQWPISFYHFNKCFKTVKPTLFSVYIMSIWYLFS